MPHPPAADGAQPDATNAVLHSQLEEFSLEAAQQAIFHHLCRRITLFPCFISSTFLMLVYVFLIAR